MLLVIIILYSTLPREARRTILLCTICIYNMYALPREVRGNCFYYVLYSEKYGGMGRMGKMGRMGLPRPDIYLGGGGSWGVVGKG